MNALTACVDAIEYQGAHVKLTLALPGEEEFVAQMPADDFFHSPLQAGERVGASWPVGETWLLEGASASEAGTAVVREAAAAAA